MRTKKEQAFVRRWTQMTAEKTSAYYNEKLRLSFLIHLCNLHNLRINMLWLWSFSVLHSSYFPIAFRAETRYHIP